MLLATPLAFAKGGTGSIRIDPPLPDMTASPAVFEIWAQSGTAYDPHVFLVITESCKIGLTGDTIVSWTGASSPLTIEEGDWIGPETNNGDKIPTPTTPGAGYTVASLKDHLDTTEALYWIFEPILEDPLTSEKETITISLHSSNPEMLVYILGKHEEEATEYDDRVPPTIPGFVVPEIPLGTLMGLASMFAALALLSKRPAFTFRK
ncbi:MAG: hypothetical protein ACXAB7_07420 [Candidatus Kariarchaeaceae archaeon]